MNGNCGFIITPPTFQQLRKNVLGLRRAYESLRSLIIWLGLAELAWLTSWLMGTGDAATSYLIAVVGWVIVMLGWLLLAVRYGRRGFFLQHSRHLSNLIGAVLVVAFTAIWFAIFPDIRNAVMNASLTVSNQALASIHILRLLAAGTVIKYFQRQLPLHFVIWGSIPDFLFAVSAVFVVIAGPEQLLTNSYLLVWHVIGIIVFLGAAFSMFFSVPSPFRIFHDDPDTSIVFQFPMTLAPNYTVPLFMLAHLFALTKLAQQV